MQPGPEIFFQIGLRGGWWAVVRVGGGGGVGVGGGGLGGRGGG